jgi:hypothetical protein
VGRAGVHGGDERVLVRRRDAGLDGDREEAIASSLPHARDCDDRIGNDAYCRNGDGDDSGGVYSVSSADARRSMIRRRWTLPLNVVAYCF